VQYNVEDNYCAFKRKPPSKPTIVLIDFKGGIGGEIPLF